MSDTEPGRKKFSLFFTYTGRVVAILALLMGIIMLVFGIVSIGDGLTTEKLRQYIGGGIYTMVVAIGLGILAEISLNIARRDK